MRKPVSRVNLRTCDIPGCARKHNARGLCGPHYLMWWKHGDPLFADKGLHKGTFGQKPNTAEDFWDNVDTSGNCWIWKLAKDREGYGFFWWKNKQIRAHRFVAQEILGWEIKGLQVCHECDNPSCVNPDHLFLGTHTTNMEDCVKKGRQQKGERCHTAKLKEEDVREVRARLANGDPPSRIAKEKGVTKSCIQHIGWGKTWKHVL